MTSTQVACHLSLNFVVSEGGNARLVTLPLLPLTGLFFMLWSMRQAVDRFTFELATLADELKLSVIFTAKLIVIGVNALAFGLRPRVALRCSRHRGLHRGHPGRRVRAPCPHLARVRQSAGFCVHSLQDL